MFQCVSQSLDLVSLHPWSRVLPGLAPLAGSVGLGPARAPAQRAMTTKSLEIGCLCRYLRFEFLGPCYQFRGLQFKVKG